MIMKVGQTNYGSAAGDNNNNNNKSKYTWDDVLKREKEKIKTRCEKGIPARVRGQVWKLLARSTSGQFEQRKKTNFKVNRYICYFPFLLSDYLSYCCYSYPPLD